MRIAPVTDQTTLAPAREALQPLLSLGKRDKAVHELQVLLDNPADDATHNALKTIAALLKGDESEIARFMALTRNLLTDDRAKRSFSHLLVDTAICLALEGNVTLATLAIREADAGLDSHGEEGVAAQSVQTILQLAEDKAMARSNYYDIKATWLITESSVILGWLQVVGLAVSRITEDQMVLKGVLHSHRPLPFVQDEARKLERKFRRKTRLSRVIGPVFKRH